MSDDARSRQQPPGPRSPGGRARGVRAGDSPEGTLPPILDQVFDTDSLYALRAAMAAHASAAGVPRGRAEDIVIAVHELAANAVRHGAGHGRLRVWQIDGSLRCEVTDDGRPATSGGTGPAIAGVTGSTGVAPWRILPSHGLWLVRHLADQTSLHTGPLGTVAVVTFGMSSPSE